MAHATARGIWWARVGARVFFVGLLVSVGVVKVYTQSKAQAQYSYYLPLLMLTRPIAFESDRDGNYYHDLYLMNADGGNVVRVPGPDSVSCPSWSPDGKSLLYASVLTRHIYAINADGTNLTQLTAGSRREDSPAWSPDQQYVVFSVVDGLAGGLYAIRPGQPGEMSLIWSSFHAFWSPKWSSDGQRLVFTSNLEGSMEIYAVYMIATPQMIRFASPINRLTSNAYTDGSPDWSPDGSSIVFESDRDGDPEIWVMRADGTEQTQLTFNHLGDSSPVWSPDGTQILFTSERDGGVDVFVMNADGSSPVNLTNSPYWEGCASWKK